MGTLATSEDPDEMPHNAAFHQGLHYLLRQKWSLEKNTILFRKYNPWLLNLYNGPSQVYCIKQEGKG